MMSRLRRAALVAIGVGAVAAVGGVALTIYKDRTWIETPPYARREAEPARTLVVVYSRTGNTLGAAKEAARYFEADLLSIEAPQYSRDLKGLGLAARHGAAEITTTQIEHEPVDLEQYDLIVLCSPTWLFRPAPPLWSFVENHDFAGRPVFLLMTGNSRLKEENIETFGTLVASKKGHFLGNLFVRRGRIYWQKSPREIDHEVREELERRHRIWPKDVGTR